MDVSLLLLLSSSLLSILLCISLPPRRTGSSSSCSTGTQVCLLTCLLAYLLAYKLAMAGMRLPTEHRATLLARFLQSPRALPCLSLSCEESGCSPGRAVARAVPPLDRPSHPSPLSILDSSSPVQPARALRSNGFLTSPTPPSPPASTDAVDARFD